MSVHKKNQKHRELFQIRNVISCLNKEFCGECIINECESPDFEIILPNQTVVGLEVTECCPSEKKGRKGKGRIKDIRFEQRIIESLLINPYLLKISETQKFSLMIDATSEIHRKNNRVDDWSSEFEYHLKLLFDSPDKRDIPTRLIRRIRYFKTINRNSINFNHTARRDPIHAKELIEVIHNKELLLPHYKTELINNCWLCIFLPWQENRHPYWVEYDDLYSESNFKQDLQNSKFNRIFVTSEVDIDLTILKPQKLL